MFDVTRFEQNIGFGIGMLTQSDGCGRSQSGLSAVEAMLFDVIRFGKNIGSGTRILTQSDGVGRSQ